MFSADFRNENRRAFLISPKRRIPQGMTRLRPPHHLAASRAATVLFRLLGSVPVQRHLRLVLCPDLVRTIRAVGKREGTATIPDAHHISGIVHTRNGRLCSHGNMDIGTVVSLVRRFSHSAVWVAETALYSLRRMLSVSRCLKRFSMSAFASSCSQQTYCERNISFASYIIV